MKKTRVISKVQIKLKIRKPNIGIIFLLPTICLYLKNSNAPVDYLIGVQIHWFNWAMAIYLQYK